jgi:hypothetical protein
MGPASLVPLTAAAYDASIRASLGLAKKTLNWYYNMTDWSEVYHIAMGTYCIANCKFIAY